MDKSNSIFTKISAYLIVSIMVALFFTIGIRIFTRIVLIEHFSMDNQFTRIVMFDNETLAKATVEEQAITDWVSKYPFETKEVVDSEQADTTLISSFVERIEKMKERIGDYSKTNLVFYTKFAEAAKAYNNLLNWSIEKHNEETIITCDDGYILGTIWEIDTKPYIENICEFNAFLKENDMPFLYAALPGKISQQDEGIYGVLDFSNQNVDALLAGIRNDGVEVLDFREKIAENFDNNHERFFITDPHWTPETGLWAAGELASYLNENHGFDFDLEKLDSQNFSQQVYEGIFLGAHGRKATISTVKPENLVLYYPKSSVDLSVEIPTVNLNARGDFGTIYNYQKLEGDIYNNAPYAVYLYGNPALVTITNHQCDNDKSILVIGDSMDNVMLPFLSLGVKRITAMDLRDFNGSVQTYIKEHKDEYDMVLVTNSVSGITVPSLYDFS